MGYNRDVKGILPQNYRFITALKTWEERINLTATETKKKRRSIIAKFKKLSSRRKKEYVTIIIALEGIFLLSFLITNFLLFKDYTSLKEKRVSAVKALVSWEKESAKYPKYPETYYNAALYAKAVGDREKALEYVNQSLILNPNFEASKKLQEKLLQ